MRRVHTRSTSSPPRSAASLWERYRRAIASESLPLALVDLDAFDENVQRLVARVEGTGKTLRPATKSVRVPALLRAIAAQGGPLVRGLMTYSARETEWLASRGFDDLLLAYPTVQRSDVDAIARTVSRGTTLRVVCDAPEHLDALEAAAERISTTTVLQVLLEIDLSYRPIERVHLGVRRSPLRTAADAVAFAERVARTKHLRLAGVMAYEAHVAGLGDRGGSTVEDAAKWAMKHAARPVLEETRREVARALTTRGHALDVFNGGGTGSMPWAIREEPLTEVTAGSGFLDSHLFDRYRDVPLVPAAYFALQVVRRPTESIVTCAGGGYVASGAIGNDRLPIPALPEGARLLSMEGAGEVQTPIELPRGTTVALGDAVFFRHAKAGELAEHFNEYLLVRGDRIVDRVRTYRGEGECFLG